MLKIKKLKPMFTTVITTADKYEKDEYVNGLIVISKGELKEYQTVVAVGDSVRNVKVGDLVKINPKYYVVRKHQEGSLKDGVITDNPVVKVNFPLIEINDVVHLMLQDRDIDYVIEEYELVESEETPKIITSPSGQKLILPEGKKHIITDC